MDGTQSHRPGPSYFTLRTIAAAIDYAIVFALTFAYFRYFGTPTDEGYVLHGCTHLFAIPAMWVVLIPLPEGLFGRTFGKWACDLSVVDLYGRPITSEQAFLRRLLDPIDLLSMFGLVGFFVAKSNPLNQRLGDLVAKSRVIATPAAQNPVV